YRPTHELPPDDPRLGPIEADCRTRYLGTKPAVAHFAIQDCVDRRVAALFEPPPTPPTAGERRDRERAACRMQGKMIAVMACLDRVDHPSPPPPPEPPSTPEDRARRGRMRCQMMGKPIQIHDCLGRLRRD
ncbi:MAG TPA: hypothetical protein VLJ37_03920, partial [bacterium]|nr:hypothetical protein [bacterium]